MEARDARAETLYTALEWRQSGPMKKHRISVRFVIPVWRWLQDEAQRRGLSVSTLVALIVTAAMDGDGQC